MEDDPTKTFTLCGNQANRLFIRIKAKSEAFSCRGNNISIASRHLNRPAQVFTLL